MDQYLSAVIIAIITGIFGVITVLIQKKQNDDIKKIDKKASGLSKEKKLKNELAKNREDLETTINQIMMLILDTNIKILADISPLDDKNTEQTLLEAETLKQQFHIIMRQIKDINHEYQLLLNLTQELESSSSSDKHKE